MCQTLKSLSYNGSIHGVASVILKLNTIKHVKIKIKFKIEIMMAFVFLVLILDSRAFFSMCQDLEC